MNSEIKKTLVSRRWCTQAANISLLTGDASSRKYYRIKEDNKVYILCEDKSVIEKKSKHNFLTMQKILEENKIPVPKILDVDFDNGLILQSDLGDQTMLSLNANSESSKILKIYQSAIDVQLEINSIRGPNLDLDVFTLKFDSEKLMQEMDLTIKHFIKSYLDINDDEFAKQLRDDLLSVVSEVASLPRVTTHRDYHSRNIMISNSQLNIIDFQDARQGIPQYDLVSLVDDCYFNLSTSDKEYLKKYYYRKAKDRKIFNGEYSDFVYQYDLMKIQRTLKAIGSFCFINDTKENARYLKYVGHAFNNIRESLIKKTKFSALGSLVKLYYEK